MLGSVHCNFMSRVDTVDGGDAFRPAMSCLQNNAAVLPALVRCESKKSRQHRHAAAVRTSSDSCATLETTSRHPISVNPVNVLVYWGHRLQHRVEFLWRFHSIHHSAEHLDWLAAHREHPLDTVYTMGLINLPAFVMGFPLETLAGLLAFRGIWAIYIHSNVRLPIGPLRMLFGAPELHHWHHSREREAGNYANISPLMDLIFGTYRCPPHEPEMLGVSEPMPRSYLSQLLPQFRRRRS